MVVLFLIVMPMLLVHAAARLVSRQKVSKSFALYRCATGVLLSVVLCCVWLIPHERMSFFADDGRLNVMMGKSAMMILAAASAVLGACFGLFVQESEGGCTTRKGNAFLRVCGHVLLLIALILTQGCVWGSMVYPNITFEEIIFHIRMPLEGTAQSFTASAVHSVLLPALIGFVLLEILFAANGNKQYMLKISERINIRLFPVEMGKWRNLLILFWFAAVITVGNNMLDIDSYLEGYLDRSSFIEENYVDPRKTEIVFPEEKRNLITIYLESLESTVQDTVSGGQLEQNYIPELTRIAQENVSFSRSVLLEGAKVAPACDWTIAALVAQTAGVPFKLHGTRGEMHSQFLPGVFSLGDILKREGYYTMFMAGSDFSFGGRRAYYTQHGEYEVYDLLTARENGKLPDDYSVFWGFEDFRLYEYAKEELTKLAAQEQPFHFSMLTVDTHSPGYRCPICPTDYMNKGRDVYNYVDILRCCSLQLDAFIAWCKEQPFFENTTIVVTGDHESMQNFFFQNIAGAKDGRYIYNAFINPAKEPLKEKNRLFTTMDFFPTVLGSMGVEIQGNRLGLGTNLFSDEQTLSEKYGEDELMDELGKYSTYYDEELLYP